MSELPSGWEWLRLEEIVSRTANLDPSKYADEMFELYSVPSHATGSPELLHGKEIGSTKQLVEPGDVLLCKIIPHLVRVWVVPPVSMHRQIASGEWIVYRQHGCNSEFLRYALVEPSFREQFMQTISGVGGSLTRAKPEAVARIAIAVAPLPEQRRIVAKLDTLLAGVTQARKEIDRVPTLIAQYKEALLAAAFSGELTSDWRESNPDRSSRSARQNQLAAERAQLAASLPTRRSGPMFDSAGSRVPVDLGTLPDCWSLCTLESVTDPSRLIQYGILKPGPDIEGGVPYVKVMNIQRGRVLFDKIRRTTREIHLQYRRSEIRTGDILLSIRGTVGRLAFVPPELDGGNITQDSVRIAVLESVEPKFIYWYLHSPAAQTYMQRNMKGVAVRGINVGDVRPMEVPLPRIEEQREIVRQIEEAFAGIDGAAIECRRVAELLPWFENATLAKAFRGELVPQDPADESALVLLERIRAERASNPDKQHPGRGRGPRIPRAPEEKSSMTKSRSDEEVKGQPYLAGLLKQDGGGAAVELLFRRADLPVADFYKQLAWEIAEGHIVDSGEKLEVAA